MCNEYSLHSRHVTLLEVTEKIVLFLKAMPPVHLKHESSVNTEINDSDSMAVVCCRQKDAKWSLILINWDQETMIDELLSD